MVLIASSSRPAGDNGDSDALKKNKRKQKKEPAFELKEKEQVEGIVEESGIAKLLQSLEEGWLVKDKPTIFMHYN